MRTHEQIRQDLLANEKKVGRWRTRVKRAMTMLEKAERRTRHLEKLMTREVGPVETDHMNEDRFQRFAASRKEHPKPTLSETTDAIASAMIQGASFEQASAAVEKPSDDLTIPGFLRRSKKDQEAIDKAKAEREERQKAKAKVQAEKRKAKRSGDAKRMPLTGRDAARFIASGK